MDSLWGMWSLPVPRLVLILYPSPKCEAKPSESIQQNLVTATTSWHSSSPEFFTTFLHHCNFFFLPPFPAVITHRFPCKMPLPSLFLLQSFKNNRKTQNLIKSMYLFPYAKWNANTKLFYRENLLSSVLVTALGQGGHKQTRLFILSLSKSSKSLNPNVRGETLIVSLFPIFCPTDLVLKNSGKSFWERKVFLKFQFCFKVQTFPSLSYQDCYRQLKLSITSQYLNIIHDLFHTLCIQLIKFQIF